jgi:hypothetical protein
VTGSQKRVKPTDTLWIANTQQDEIVASDIVRELVSERVSLSAYDSAPKVTSYAVEEDDDEPKLVVDEREVVDEFHCNQIFEGFDRDLYTGPLCVRQLAVDTAHRPKIGQTPNSPRRRHQPDHGPGGTFGVERISYLSKDSGAFWVCDSARSMTNVYDRAWVLEETISSEGWV